MNSQKQNLSRLLVHTQNPARKGGVLALLKKFVEWTQGYQSLNVTLTYNSNTINDPTNVSVPAICRGQWSVKARKETWEGINSMCVGRFAPELESLQSLGNMHLWNNLINTHDYLQVICGYAVTGLPLARAKKPFVIWVASSMDGDKRVRVPQLDMLRRLVHKLQYKVLCKQERYVLESANWVFALSDYTKTDLLSRGANPDRISVLPAPINTWKFHPNRTPKNSAPSILWVARHADPRKNTKMLVRAFSRIAKKVPDSKLILVGETKGTTIQQTIDEMNLTSQVELRGFREDDELPHIYQSADIFAIPSDQEGLCIAGLEAMASGLPVVSTRCGGPESFVIPNQTGLLVDPNSESNIADALLFLLTNDRVRSTLGNNGRMFVEKHYSFDSFNHHLKQVYLKIWPESLK